MYVCFQGFWNGFMEKDKDPVNVSFFLEFLKNVFETDIEVGSPETADILVESCWARIDVPSLVDIKPWKYKIFYTGESFYTFTRDPNFPFNKYTSILGFRGNNLNFVKLPLFVLYKTLYPNCLPPVTTVPKYSACAVIGNANGHFRNTFLDSLEKVLPISYGGTFRNNIGKTVGGTHAGDELINFYHNFKFVIAMENSSEEYYITEKLYNAMRAGTIPVYWGSLNADKYFNPDRFLHVRNEYEIQKVIKRMLTMTDSEYLDIVQRPIFVEGVDAYSEAVQNTKRLIGISSQE
jgi:Glycosyltransferase family 10 (fucosyltransferase) C-term